MQDMFSNAYVLINQFLAIMGLIFLVAGAALLLMPATTLKIIQLANTWIDTDRWFSVLDNEVTSEAFIYRHHRVFGAIILIASIWIFRVFVIRHSVGDFQALLITGPGSIAQDWLVHSFIFLIRMLSVLFVVLGCIIFFRPSLLKSVEHALNRWITTDVDTSLETPHKGADEFLSHHPRLSGGFVFCAGLYLSLSAALMLSG
ncbi:MAG: hypothetical protein MI673_06135 [Thiotrichales bacterium]|nr:hypothetical protein [Thiotrichales bacterium]